MEVLFDLEEKVKTLVAYAKNLKEQLCVVQPENNSLKIENDRLATALTVISLEKITIGEIVPSGTSEG